MEKLKQPYIHWEKFPLTYDFNTKEEAEKDTGISIDKDWTFPVTLWYWHADKVPNADFVYTEYMDETNTGFGEKEIEVIKWMFAIDCYSPNCPDTYSVETDNIIFR